MPSFSNWNGTIDEKRGEWPPSGALHILHHISTAVAQHCSLVAVVLQFQPGASCWKCRDLKARQNPSVLEMILQH